MPADGSDALVSDTQAVKRTAYRNLRELRQKGSASDYASQFRQIAVSLGGWNDEPLKFLFYDRLKEVIKDKLYIEDWPETLDEYIAMAVRIDNRLYARRLEKRARRSSNFNSGQRYK